MYKNISVSLLAIVMLQAVANLYADPRIQLQDERAIANRIRIQAARTQTIARAAHNMDNPGNGDEQNVPNYANSYSKQFYHNPEDSILTSSGAASFEMLVAAEDSGLQQYYNAIQFSEGSQRLLINPQAGFAFSMQGMDSSLFSMPNYPTLTSDWMGAEILEVYLMMCCRDVKFDEYGTGEGTDNDGNGGSITAQAAAVLNSLGDAYHGPRNSDGIVDASVLFRGMTAGDQVGPYVSQFLLQKLYPLFPAGCAGFVATLIGVQNLNQNIISTKQLYPIAEKREFGVSWEDFIAIQNGFIPKLYAVTDYNQTHLRYIITGRDIASLDHADTPFGYYTNVLIILAHAGFPINPNFPYANGTITRESAGFDMGAPDAFTLVGGVCSEAFKAAWAQKWRTFRRARPEAICGLVNYAKINNVNPYSLSPIIFETHAGVDVLAWALAHNQLQALAEYDPQQLLTLEEASTYLLAQVFPEGSPTHPAYPSGHSVVAGACTTVIKAIFNDLTPLKPLLTPVIVDPLDPENLIPLTDGSEDLMTVGSELDKLASNVANGRDIAGVHWRSDGDAGLLLGEYVAICYLQDQARKYPEAGFTGFRLTKRDGTRILITANSVTTIG